MVDLGIETYYLEEKFNHSKLEKDITSLKNARKKKNEA
jgi:hypothetical protein